MKSSFAARPARAEGARFFLPVGMCVCVCERERGGGGGGGRGERNEIKLLPQSVTKVTASNHCTHVYKQLTLQESYDIVY